MTLTPPAKDGGKDVVLRCYVQGRQAEYFVEIKHWRSPSRVGGGALRDFLNVIVREGRDGGLFLSTYGYCDNAFDQLVKGRDQAFCLDADRIALKRGTMGGYKQGIVVLWADEAEDEGRSPDAGRERSEEQGGIKRCP